MGHSQITKNDFYKCRDGVGRGSVWELMQGLLMVGEVKEKAEREAGVL